MLIIPSVFGVWLGLIIATLALWALSGPTAGYTAISASIMTIILFIMAFNPQGELSNIMIDNIFGMGESVVEVYENFKEE